MHDTVRVFQEFFKALMEEYNELPTEIILPRKTYTALLGNPEDAVDIPAGYVFRDKFIKFTCGEE